MSETNFIEPNKKSKWGQSDVQMWMGVVVSFDAQKDQIEKGYGWKYRVRILGDHAVNETEIKMKISVMQLVYCQRLLELALDIN